MALPKHIQSPRLAALEYPHPSGLEEVVAVCVCWDHARQTFSLSFFLAPASASSILGSGSAWAGLANCLAVPGERALPPLPPPQPLSLHPEVVCSPVGGAGNEKSSRGWLEGPDKQSPLPCYPATLWGPCLLSLGGKESEHLFSSSSCLNESPACTCWFLETAHISQ